MPGIVCLVVTIIVNYIGHKTKLWRTICSTARDLPLPVVVAGLAAFYGWFTPHLLWRFKEKRTRSTA